MRFARLLAGCAVVAAIGVLSSDSVNSQEKKDVKLKHKGAIPQRWSKLGLSDKQKDEVYRLQDEHWNKLDPIREQIAILDAQLVKNRLGVLTEEQRKKLREMVAGKNDDDDGKDKAKTKDKDEARLPSDWTKLGLSDKQKEEIFKLLDEHKDKVDVLKEQIAKLDTELVKGRLNVLTDEQRKKLRESVGSEPPPKDKK
jgi:hypothetical protein